MRGTIFDPLGFSADRKQDIEHRELFKKKLKEIDNLIAGQKSKKLIDLVEASRLVRKQIVTRGPSSFPGFPFSGCALRSSLSSMELIRRLAFTQRRRGCLVDLIVLSINSDLSMDLIVVV